jgi:hypothetical protein
MKVTACLFICLHVLVLKHRDSFTFNLVIDRWELGKTDLIIVSAMGEECQKVDGNTLVDFPIVRGSKENTVQRYNIRK